MANNGGTVIADKTKLKVSTFEGTAASIQTSLRAAIANNDVIISCDMVSKHGASGLALTVVLYDVA